MKGIGLAKAEWRHSPWAWTPLAWLLAVLWPPVSLTLLVFPPAPHAVFSDWRLWAMAAAAIGVGGALFLIARERDRDGHPSTRLGVIMRFFIYGALFTVAAQVLAAIALAFATAPFLEGVGPFLGALKSTLFVIGVAAAPFALMVGLSYALWAGAVVAFVAFAPKPPSVRLHAMNFGTEPAE